MTSGEKDQRAKALNDDVSELGFRQLADARQLCLRHHSTVELVDRLVDRGALIRRPCDQDHREVLVQMTSHGETLLHRLSVLHWKELRVSGPALSDSLRAVVNHSRRTGEKGA
jgi:DNA-binding MarR family transcriptional regulator